MKKALFSLAAFSVLASAVSTAAKLVFRPMPANRTLLTRATARVGAEFAAVVALAAVAGVTGGNVIALQVGCGYVNMPCVSLTIRR